VRLHLLILTLLLTAPLCAATIHVAPNGNDQHPGTADKPLASMPKAIEILNAAGEPGEVIVHGGRYFVMWHIPAPESAVDPAPIVIRSADGELAIVDGGMPVENARPTPIPDAPGAFRMSSQENWGNPSTFWEQAARRRYQRVLDLEAVRRFPATWARISDKEIAFHTSDSGPFEGKGLKHNYWPAGNLIQRSNVTFRGIQIDNHGTGIEVRRAHDVVIEDCTILNASTAIYVARDAERTTIRRCDTHDVSQGVLVHGADTTIENSRFIKLKDDFTPRAGNAQDDAGIQFYSPAQHGWARGNVVAGFHGGIFMKSSAHRYIVENNTIVGARWGLFHNVWKGSDSRFERNILLNCSEPLDGVPNHLSDDMCYDNNVIWGTPDQLEHDRYIVKAVDDIGGGSNNVIADPMFADVSNHDYRLMQGSPAFNLAVDGRPAGALGPVPQGFVQPTSPLPTPPTRPVRTASPAIVGRPGVRTSATGVVFTFRTTRPCIAQIIYTPLDLPLPPPDPALKVRHHYDESPAPTDSHAIAIRMPGTTPDFIGRTGDRFRYRIQLQDEPGSEKMTTTQGVFTLRGDARTFQIAIDGIDAEDRGGSDVPLATLQYAADRALAGDTIRLAAGMYHFPTACSIYGGGLPDAPITIEGAGMNDTIIDGLDQVSAIIQLLKAPHIVIRGMTLRWFLGAAVYIDESPHVTIDRCLVINSVWPGVFTHGHAFKFKYSPNAIVTYNIISRTEDGIYLMYSPGSTVLHNSCSGLMYGGISVLWSTVGTTVMNNAFCYAGNESAYYHAATMEDMRAMRCDYNVYAGLPTRYGSNVRFETEKPELWSRMKAEELTPTLPYYAVSKVAISGGIDGPEKIHIYCHSFEDWQTLSGHDAHSKYADPGWVDPAAGRWELRPGSALIGAGENGVSVGAVETIVEP